MNNNINNYLLNQNDQQQYINPQSFETQNGQTQKMNQFQNQGVFQDQQIRVQFFKNLYCFLFFEFLFNLVMIALGIYTDMIFWLLRLYEICYYDEENYQYCFYGVEPSWLFYVSLFISLILQFMLYFKGNLVRNAPVNYIVLILQIVFFGFTFTTINIFWALRLLPIAVWITWGGTFLIIGVFTILAFLQKREISWQVGAIVILGISLTLFIIWIFTFHYYPLWAKFLSLVVILIYGFYLILETRLMMSQGRFNLYTNDYLIGSLLLNGLMLQPLVRIFEILSNAFGNRSM
ncbi:unnamed protein product [Paramecium pentaurelia]|uniref:Inhibitor of apoptosis-promoting Bax1 protein n=1 Tax=Paramecium pentaurelia TaxID=43138 RepID=A0A8S1YHG3_9CILI|nr:unnamed protein product [Paramecium pentaurelia]